MSMPVRRGIVTVFFILLLAAPVIIKRVWYADGASLPAGSSGDEAMRRFGFHFEEVSKQSGIDFTHQAPTLDAKLSHIMPEVASMGAAVSVVDFDRDGWPDLYVTDSAEGSLNRLYRNKTDGTFEDVAAALGVADVNRPGTGVSMGAIWGDYDDDGFEDMFLYKWGAPELFHNDGGKGFTRVTDKAGLPKWINANSAVWFDYDRDGKLDLFVGGYYPENVNLWQLENTRMMPDSFEYAKNGGRKYLFKNLGDGAFEDVTAKTGLESRRWALAAAAADLRGTGYPDLFIANDYGVSEFFANRGGARFEEVGEKTGVGFAPKSGMNVAFGDIFNNGSFAVYVTNISEEGVLIQGNNLWVPEEGTSGETLKYRNMARDLGVELGGWSFGAQFGDLNNDGNLDLYLTNGYVSLEKGTDYWYDFSTIATGNSTIIADAANWPPMKGRSLSGFQQKRVWISDGAGSFRDVAQQVGATDTFDGRSVVMADLWNRGVLDVVVANQRGPLLVYKNTVAPENNWIELSLSGRSSNRSAIGADVRVFWNGHQQRQQVAGASGFCAQSDRRLHFGLGKNARIDKIEIRWPSGRTQTLENVTPNQILVLQEPEA